MISTLYARLALCNGPNNSFAFPLQCFIIVEKVLMEISENGFKADAKNFLLLRNQIKRGGAQHQTKVTYRAKRDKMITMNNLP